MVIVLGTSVYQSVIVSVLWGGRSGNWDLIPNMKQRLLFSLQPPDQFILCSEVIQNKKEESNENEKVKVKVKQSHYWPGQALRFPGV